MNETSEGTKADSHVKARQCNVIKQMCRNCPHVLYSTAGENVDCGRKDKEGFPSIQIPYKGLPQW